MADLAPPLAAEPALPSLPSSSVSGAIADAAAAAARAGAVVREPDRPDEIRRVCDLFRKIWSEDPAEPSLSPPLVHALSAAGSYVGAAEADGELLGACVGFYGVVAGRWALHSHIAGVTPRARGRNVGFALKTHQRAWALSRRVDRISWTFDPLVRRNAYFNLSKLAARPRAYRADYYGPMTDGVNAGDETDRLILEWRLLDETVGRACAGRPDEPDVDALLAGGAAIGLAADGAGAPRMGSVDADTVLVGVPADVERIRVVDRPCAAAWRHALRDVLGGLLEDDGAIVGFARSGWYVVRRAES